MMVQMWWHLMTQTTPSASLKEGRQPEKEAGVEEVEGRELKPKVQGGEVEDDNLESQGVVEEVEAEHPEIVDREETQAEQNAAEEMKQQLVARVSHFDSTLVTTWSATWETKATLKGR